MSTKQEICLTSYYLQNCKEQRVEHREFKCSRKERVQRKNVQEKVNVEKVKRRAIINEEKPQSGETKHMLDCPNSVCYFMRPQRLGRQGGDWWNERGEWGAWGEQMG